MAQSPPAPFAGAVLLDTAGVAAVSGLHLTTIKTYAYRGILLAEAGRLSRGYRVWWAHDVLEWLDETGSQREGQHFDDVGTTPAPFAGDVILDVPGVAGELGYSERHIRWLKSHRDEQNMPLPEPDATFGAVDVFWCSRIRAWQNEAKRHNRYQGLGASQMAHKVWSDEHGDWVKPSELAS